MNIDPEEIPAADAAADIAIIEADDISVVCSECGEPRSSVPDLPGGQRSPCPHCGSTNISARMSIHEALRPASDSVSATLTPGDQNRGWQRRWIECERALDNLIAPHNEALSSDAIHAARNALHAFYIQTYHLKDALILDAPTTGIAGDAVEKAISDDPVLALLADLANLDKHGKLTKKPRSGAVPKILEESGESGPDGWLFRMAIDDSGHRRDGLEFAQAAIA
jgi:hypothetical protein